MANATTVNNGTEKVPPRISEFHYFRRVFLNRGLVVFGMVVIIVFLLVAIFAPLLTPYEPDQPDLTSTLANPSSAHWLGTDALGRDVLARIMFGTRTSLEIGLIVVAIGSILGMALGTIAGFYGGWIYTVIMRLIDALMCFPMILLAMVIASMLGGGMRNVIVALSISLLPAYARLMCGQVLSIKQSDYIMAGRSIGASNLRLILNHLVLNSLPPLIVLITMMMGSTILAESGLSFLGIGIAPPTPSWGGMVTSGREYLLDHPLLSLSPGLALMLVVFAFNMVGDGLRDALDPRLRGLL
jgi:peptide/nickel transport system permease protein